MPGNCVGAEDTAEAKYKVHKLYLNKAATDRRERENERRVRRLERNSSFMGFAIKGQ